MTFEEWLPTFSSDNYITTADIKEIWNAAIASSLNAVDAVNKSNIDENDVLVYIYEDLRKLLTS